MSDNFLKLAPNYSLKKSGEKFVLVSEGGSFELKEIAAAILKLCDGTRSVKQIVNDLKSEFGGKSSKLESNALEFLQDALEQGWIS